MSDNPSQHPILDEARAEVLRWAIEPKSSDGKLSFAHFTPVQPYALAVLKQILHYYEQNMQAKFYTEKEGENGEIKKTPIKNPRDAIIDSEIQCEWGKDLINDISTASVGVGAKRAKLVVESTRDIGRPTTGLLGSLASLFGKKDEELDQPEEVPAYE